MKTNPWIIIVWVLLALTVALEAKRTEKIRVTVVSANIRSGPVSDAAVIGQGKRGDVFEVLGREGNWFRIRLPQDTTNDPEEGFIHQSVVEEAGGENTEREEEAVPARQKPGKAAPPPRAFQQREKLISGFFLEGGLMTSPKTDSFADKWLLGLGFDKGISPYMSLGMEFQPHFRSVPDLNLTYLSCNVFINVRGGINLGQLTPALKFWTPYAGFGPGAALSFTHVANERGNYNKFKASFAYHFTFGSEFSLGAKGLFVEFQIVRVSQPEVDPDSSAYFLVAGIRF